MDQIALILDTINLLLWLVVLLALFCFSYIAKSYGKINSSLITLVVVLSAGAIMVGYKAFLLTYEEIYPESLRLIWFFWFVGFAQLNILTIIAITQSHLLLGIERGLIAKFMTQAYYVMGALQLIQYIEILITGESEYIKWLYKSGITAVNVGTALCSLLLGMQAVYAKFTLKDGIKGLKWTV